MNNQERFELLSAYLDRELPSDQIQQVEQWLSRDPEAQKTYQNLLKLRYQLRESTVPSLHSSQEKLTETVVAKANYQAWKQTLMWGGGTIAALFITLISGSLFSNYSPLPRLANSGNPDRGSESLMIALNQPVVEIPMVPRSRSSERQKEIPLPRSNR